MAGGAVDLLGPFGQPGLEEIEGDEGRDGDGQSGGRRDEGLGDAR